MGRILGIDYGLKRTGLAVTDPLQIIVSPLETVETTNLSCYLKKYLSDEKVDKIVLGYPLDLEDNPTDSTSAVDKLHKKLLHNHPEIDVVLEEEQFTSKKQHRLLWMEDSRRKKDRRKVRWIVLVQYLY